MAGGALVQLTTRSKKTGYIKMRRFRKGQLAKAMASTWKPRSRIPMNIFGLGNSATTKMEYIANLSFSTGANPTGLLFAGQQSFRLNNINLPFVGQADTFSLPQGYTQAAQAFKYFKVLGAKVRAEFHSPSVDCQVGRLVTSSGDVFDLQADNVSLADVKKQCVVKPLSVDGSRRVVLSTNVSIASIEGLKKAQFNGDFTLYSMPFNASVAAAEDIEDGSGGDLVKKRIPKLHLAIAANDSGATAVTCKCKLTITYTVYCWGKTTLPQSTSSA